MNLYSPTTEMSLKILLNRKGQENNHSDMETVEKLITDQLQMQMQMPCRFRYQKLEKKKKVFEKEKCLTLQSTVKENPYKSFKRTVK